MIPDCVIRSFKDSLRGKFPLPSDPGYDIARSIVHVMIDRWPAVIVRCAGPGPRGLTLFCLRVSTILVAVCGGEATASLGSWCVKVGSMVLW